MKALHGNPSNEQIDRFLIAYQSKNILDLVQLIREQLKKTDRNDIDFEIEITDTQLSEHSRNLRQPILARISANHFRLEFPKDFLPEEPWWVVLRVFTLAELLYECCKRIVVPKNLIFQLADYGCGPTVCWGSADPTATLIPDPLFLITSGYQALKPWQFREPIIYWRGQPNGTLDWIGWLAGNVDVVPRAKLCLLSTEIENFDCKLVNPQRVQKLYERFPHLYAENRDPIEKVGSYQFAIDVDGWGTAWMGLFAKMLFGCTILKVSSLRNLSHWFYPRFIPWQHYVPIKSDLSDLREKAEWCLIHPIESERLAANAKELADNLTFTSEIQLTLNKIFSAPDFE
jgi:hypothetical protein